ncbi:MAG TPA: AMP-binding protein, partial [Bacteroidota bacterium]|nr:AMP-binding protein [Bacteroidota bacterium]
YEIGPYDAVMQFASLSFDPSIEQIFSALCSGARLVIRGDEVWSAAELAQRVDEDEVTVMNLPTAYWHEISRAMPAPRGQGRGTLRLVIAGGEAMTCEALDAWRKTRFAGVRLLNAYGPTEATVTAFLFDCTGYPTEGLPPSSPVPIGRPVPGRLAYVCDEGGNPVPPGIQGELYIGGECLARGYLNSPELTAEKFVRNHTENLTKSLLYRTGDIVRVTPRGVFEYLGRVDDQCKVRGYRVEPGEIASVLKRHPSVRDAYAVIRRDAQGEGSITAYAAAPGVTGAELRGFAGERLPAYMVPRSIVVMDRLPLLPSGKIDRGSLPEPPGEEGVGGAEYVPPRNALEAQLAALWEKLLGRSPVGVRDDFFALGGHSLLAARLFAQIEALTGKNLPLATLFRAPTIEALALALERGGSPAWGSLVPIRTGGTLPPFYCVHAAGGNVVGYQHLAERLGPDQPVYGLQARGLDGESLPLETVEEMAALYVREIRALQPRGPYYLGGACTGGIVAYEMARQIVAAGGQVGLLAMFDTFAHGVFNSLTPRAMRRFRFESTLERAAFHARNLFLEPGRIRYVRRKLRTITRRVNTRLWSLRRARLERRHREIPPALVRVEEYNMLAIRRYGFGTYPGKITLFPPGDRSVGEYHDPQQGWGALALGGVEIQHVTGNHLTMLDEPNVNVVAEKLAMCLERARGEHAENGSDGRGS